VLFQSLELLNGAEKLNQLGDTAFEKVKAAEDLGRREIELLRLGHMLESLLGELVLTHVGLMESKALAEDHNQLFVRDEVLVPEDAVVESRATLLLASLHSLDLLESKDVHLTVGDHLVSDLDEEAGHAFVSVVVASDGVDHLDGIHEDGQGLADGDWISVIQRLDKTLQSLEVLDVILGFVEGLSDFELDTPPVAESQVNVRIGVFILLALADGGEDILDGSAVLVAELLADLSEHSHAELPVFELVSRAFASIALLGRFGLLESCLNLFRPLSEDSHEVVDHFLVRLAARVDGLGRCIVLIIVLLKHDVAVKGLQGFLQLASELLKDNGKVALLLRIAHTPIFCRQLLDERFVDGVHKSVELEDRIL